MTQQACTTNPESPITESRAELVTRSQRFGAQAMLDEVAELLVQKQSEHREKLEHVFARFVTEPASRAPFSEILRLRLRGRAFEEVIAELVRLVHAFDLALPDSLRRLHAIDTVPAPRGLYMRRQRTNG